MSWFCRPYKVVIRYLHCLPQLFNALNNFVDIFLRRHSRFLSDSLYLLTVLVCSRQEMHIIARKPFEARHRVSHYRAVGMSYMQVGAWIINRGSNVICSLFLCHHIIPFLTGSNGRRLIRLFYYIFSFLTTHSFFKSVLAARKTPFAYTFLAFLLCPVCYFTFSS